MQVEMPSKNDWHMFCKYITIAPRHLTEVFLPLLSLCGAVHEGRNRLCTPAYPPVATLYLGEAGRTERRTRHRTAPTDYGVGKDQCRTGTRGRRAQAGGARITASRGKISQYF